MILKSNALLFSNEYCWQLTVQQWEHQQQRINANLLMESFEQNLLSDIFQVTGLFPDSVRQTTQVKQLRFGSVLQTSFGRGLVRCKRIFKAWKFSKSWLYSPSGTKVCVPPITKCWVVGFYFEFGHRDNSTSWWKEKTT